MTDAQGPASTTRRSRTSRAATPAPPLGSPASGTPSASRGTKQRITEAALELFDEFGYDATTIDAIAQRAGVSRRSFFHHFSSKDAVIFDDHVALVARVEGHLEEQANADPVADVGGGLTLVLRAFASDPALALRRYDLVRRTPELRSTEISWVHRYHVLFAQYLSRRYQGRAHGDLVAEMTAGALVSLHNNILRTWLKGGAVGDPTLELDEALARFRHALTLAERGQGEPRLVVAVFDDDVDPQTLVRAVKDAAARR